MAIQRLWRRDGRRLPIFPATRRDKWLFSVQNKIGQIVSPIDTDFYFVVASLFSDYGRQVARDLREQNCDVIHLQHCSQYAPADPCLEPPGQKSFCISTQNGFRRAILPYLRIVWTPST